MVGQKRLQEKFNSMSINELPHTMMFVGEMGCGKHTFVSMLATRFNLEIENISSKLSYDDMSNILLCPIPKMYLIDTNLQESAQNALLKFIEEPPKSAFISILTDSVNNYLSTICGRCTTYIFDGYTESELSQFCNNERYLKYFRTPGKLLNVCSEENDWVFELNKTILTKISIASIPNTLILLSKFGYKQDDTSLNVEIELPLLNAMSIDMYRSTENPLYLEVSKLIGKYLWKFKIPNVDKKKLFCLFLLDLKVCAKQYDNTGTKN